MYYRFEISKEKARFSVVVYSDYNSNGYLAIRFNEAYRDAQTLKYYISMTLPHFRKQKDNIASAIKVASEAFHPRNGKQEFSFIIMNLNIQVDDFFPSNDFLWRR